jgi:hypothetical protein
LRANTRGKDLDWEVELRQRARELSVMRELGITMAQAAPQQNTDREEVDKEEEEDANV